MTLKLSLCTFVAFMVFSFFSLADCRASSKERAVGVPHHLKRDTSPLYRGWALSIPTECPKNTFRCGKATCCPDNSWCGTEQNTNSNICCPEEAGCGFQVALDSRCADTSWVLWETNKDPICCLEGQTGVQPAAADYYGKCVPAASSVASESLATMIGSGPTAFIPIPSNLCGTTAPPPTVSIMKRSKATVAARLKV
ncbi:uncharacterized protein PV07_02393 [Cladophialophora immunda]|uniref:Granulins domain-containing protein n=1 Tax=Cladophialophora immunda TaxID=569365 RepID=A0A0D2A5R9_9EURO|nr:uncharacterized protein PV07_02393 [Cladophialophora immunda]KIW35711.1 hypothetical protein PV07_02393 [Cladophialophora immunda]OQV05012.1 hypothetical protein CLAIMM_09816 [Cladophialophora immunda]